MRRIGYMAEAIGLAAAGPALADWSGNAQAGRVVSSGNTETETANAKLELVNEVDAWKHKFGGAALYASDEEGTTADR
jgi:putative salt-induced outer membrane protein